MYYEDSLIENIRAQSDIVDVVSQVVRLERKGARYFGLCPFHNEKTPSFCVTPSRQMYYCFGCHEGGNVFTFLQKYDNMTFSEAVEELAGRCGVTLPDKSADPEKSKRLKDEKSRLLEINKEAAIWYYKMLYSEKGSTGLAYLKKRKLTDETIRHFGLGFAPLSNDALIQYLKSKGYEAAEILKAGLAVSDEKKGFRDKFWNRVMFPIQDAGRRVIGFGGRVMGDGEPKYLNSPETPVFDKGRNLYGLCYAKSAKKGRLILCEGYMDVISMHQAGFTEAVASLGTAFTTGQAMIMKRYAQDIVLSYDSDAAGVKAALRGIGILREAGLKGKILRLAPYKDPDEFIGSEGAEAFDERIRNAENSFYFEAEADEQHHDLTDPADRTAFQKQIALRLMQTFADPLERENYLKAICARYHTDEQMMRDTIAALAVAGDTRAGSSAPDSTGGAAAKRMSTEEKKKETSLRTRRMLLTWLTDEPALLDIVKKCLYVEDFCDPLYMKLAGELFDNAQNKDFNAGALIELFPEEADRQEAVRAFNEEVPSYETSQEKERILKDLMGDIIKRSGEEHLAELEATSPSYLAEAVAAKRRYEDFLRKNITL